MLPSNRQAAFWRAPAASEIVLMIISIFGSVEAHGFVHLRRRSTMFGHGQGISRRYRMPDEKEDEPETTRAGSPILQYWCTQSGSGPGRKPRRGRRLLTRLVADRLLRAVRLGDIPPRAIMLHMPHWARIASSGRRDPTRELRGIPCAPFSLTPPRRRSPWHPHFPCRVFSTRLQRQGKC